MPFVAQRTQQTASQSISCVDGLCPDLVRPRVALQGIHPAGLEQGHETMRARQRDLVNATSSVSSLYSDQLAMSQRRRFASSVQRNWDVSHPIAYWRADGSVYRGRIEPRSRKGWFSGLLLPLSLLGIAGAYVHRYGRPDSPPLSRETATQDVKDIVTGMHQLYGLIQSMRTDQAKSGAVESSVPNSASKADVTGVSNPLLACVALEIFAHTFLLHL